MEASIDHVLSAMAVFWIHSFMILVKVVGSPPLMFNLGRGDLFLLIGCSVSGLNVRLGVRLRPYSPTSIRSCRGS